MMKRLREIGVCAISGVWVGFAIGCLTGLLELTVLLPAPSGNKLAVLLPAVLFYGMAWAMVGGVVGAARAAVCLAFHRPVAAGEASTRWDLAVLIPSAIFVVGGGHINMRYLPAFTDPFSLLFDAVFLLANVGLGYWLYRRGAAILARLISRRSWGLWLALATALLLIGGLTVSLTAAHGGAKDAQVPASLSVAQAGRPNVLLITIDALRPDHLSAYGYDRKTSPHLDELAREGVVFSWAFANSSWTKPSTATMFTSRYPSTHNVSLPPSALSPELVTLPEVLQAHGYATGLFTANAFVSPQFGFAQGVDRFYYKDLPLFDRSILGHIVSRLHERFVVPKKEGGIQIPIVPGPHLNRALIDWLRTLKGRPFFAYLHYMEPHAPYGAPAPFTVQFDVEDPDAPATPQMRPPRHIGLLPFVQGEPLAPRQVRHLIARYDGEIAYLDQVVGELFEALRELGLYDRTAIIVTADHGEEFYEHGGWGHGNSLFNELLRVPLIMRYVPAWPAGTVVTQTARHVDLMPTILDLCGIPAVNGLEGRSLVPLLLAPEAGNGSLPVYSEVFHGGSYARAVQDGDFKLIESHAGPRNVWFLFDLAEDPAERRPLDVDAHPKAEHLKRLLASFREQTRRAAVAPKTVEIDPYTKDQLRALGYLH